MTTPAPPSASPGASTPAAEFAAAWDAFGLATRRARARLAREDGIGLTPSQLHLLEPLDGQPCLTVGRIAEAAGVTAPTATRMLDGLERAGAVTRSSDTEDRRCVNVSLTESGRELVRAKRTVVAARRAQLFARLEAREGARATRVLRRLAELIEEL